MRVYIAMLRGINVTGHNKVVMKDLRELFADLGADNVKTYLQSGNVVFQSSGADAARMAGDVEGRIKSQLGLTVAVMVRTPDEFDQVLSGNPLLADGRDTRHLYVTFLATPPDPARLGALEAAARAASRDEFRLAKRHVYLHCPDGYGRTKLNNAFFERKLALVATTRNWRTVTALRDLAQG